MVDIVLHYWATYVYVAWLLVVILGNLWIWKNAGCNEPASVPFGGLGAMPPTDLETILHPTDYTEDSQTALAYATTVALAHHAPARFRSFRESPEGRLAPAILTVNTTDENTTTPMQSHAP